MKPFNPVTPASRGFGDTIAKMAKVVGIEKKPGCGCEKRQEFLNKLIPYGKKGAK
jgi:hypothetical protein